MIPASERVAPVRTWLKPETYRALDQHAKRLHTTPAELLSALADRAVRARPGPSRPYTHITTPMIVGARERLARGESLTDIARDFSCSTGGLRRALNRKEETP